MMAILAENEIVLEAQVSRKVMAARLATGLVQGLLLYWLYAAARDAIWPATSAYVMVPLMTVLILWPVLLVSSLGHLTLRKVGYWLLAALVVLLLFAQHDVWRGLHTHLLLPRWQYKSVWSPSVPLLLYSAAFFFIAHAMVLAGAHEGRRIASYNGYFETAWKLAIQLLFSVFFVGALFLVLWMGAELFMLVKLRFLRELLQQSWFNVPVVCTAFSCAMHVTDVRPAIVRGIRTLLLVLLSWILPVAVILVTGFLCTLPFTGLTALWETRHATAVLLATASVLLVLINAGFQNGAAIVALPLRVGARTAAILILPVVMVGIYALGLRVAQYGWTDDRVIAAAYLLVTTCYAIGYLWAAYEYDTWLQPLTTVNIYTAVLVLAVLLALFTPLLDPARIGVQSQMARLANGKVAAADFDFHYLRYQGGRYGKAALQTLTRASGPDAAVLQAGAKAMLAQDDKDRWKPPVRSTAPLSVADNLSVWPKGAQLPASFVAQNWADTPDNQKPSCLSVKEGKCDAFVFDADGDSKPEVLLLEQNNAFGARLYAEDSDARWSVAATLSYRDAACQPLVEKLRKGEFTLAAPRFKELDIGGQRVELKAEQPPHENCLK